VKSVCHVRVDVRLRLDVRLKSAFRPPPLLHAHRLHNYHGGYGGVGDGDQIAHHCMPITARHRPLHADHGTASPT